MPTPYLKGNCDPCDACALRREAALQVRISLKDIPCNVCKGVGYLPLDAAEIVRRTCEEARRLYWPAFDQRVQDTSSQTGTPPDARPGPPRSTASGTLREVTSPPSPASLHQLPIAAGGR